MIIYIAGKMNGLPDKGRCAFDKAEELLKREGHIVLNPAVLPDGMDAEQYMPICLSMLEQADGIALLPGWSESKGASIERTYAIYQRKTVRYISPKEMEQ